MNNEEIDYWLRYFSNHNHGFMSEDGKKITLFKMFQELKKLHYLLKIKNDYINELQQENQELKKQLDYLRRSIERKEETITELEHDRVPYTNEYVCKLEKQQKEFIDYLENEKNIYPYDISDYDYEKIINTILSKYYEIIEK